MSGYVESPVWFAVEDECLLGIVARPEIAASSASIGVVIIVGGPQYRVGSHRQFTLLARRLASAGFPTLRFDYRGMGDSTGSPRSFTEIEADIAAATRTLMDRAGIRKVVLWGLCDAASAALLSVPRLPMVMGLALVNPWVSSAESLAAVHVKHYYSARLRDREFWRKLMAGKVSLTGSLRDLLSGAASALGRRMFGAAPSVAASFQARMAKGLSRFPGPVLVALSGNDFTAREFLDHVSRDVQWKELLGAGTVSRREHPQADHTFSSAASRAWLEVVTLEWLADQILNSDTLRPAP